MENATKALLIAGSILIAVALIALGLRLLTSSNETTHDVEIRLSETEINMFNSKFEKFAENNKSYADVVSAINEVIVHNEMAKENLVGIKFIKKSTEESCLTKNTIKNVINNSSLVAIDKKYNIQCVYRKW